MESSKFYNKYISLYGHHFTKALCDFAIELMFGKDGKPINTISKQQIDAILSTQNVKLEYNKLYDYVYVANMCKADFLGEAVPNDDIHLCKYIKCVIDDPDGYEGQVFNRWLSDIKGMNIPVDWSSFV
ncbi:hypothetical protein [Sharpea azabuensis]|uniref:DUF7841 family protein n=1 Tax=Sharpea azabuensis TaxID=322505 RepID=UPI00156A4849|nr:hypothetical protein [Sharpea azabuensis]